MKFIQKILKFFYRRKLVRHAKNQIVEWKYNLKIFDVAKIDAPFEDLNELYNIKKYNSLVSSFFHLSDQIKDHNEIVLSLQNQFNDIINNHKIEHILYHIDEYPFEKLNEFHTVALQISKYRIPNTFSQKDNYLRYMRDLGEILNDYTQILNQYSLIKDFEAISFSFGDRYVDEQSAERALSPARAILEKIKEYGSKYYNIPFLDEKIVERHNEQFISNHLNDPIFDEVNGKSLDEEQRRAVLCDSKSNLVIAGAGAGKTLTICGKVKWLLETNKANEDEILLLSYSKASADDLAEKVESIRTGLKVKTFHSFGLEVLNCKHGRKWAIEDQFKAYLHKFFDEELAKDPLTASAILHFYSLYLYTDFQTEKYYATEGEKFEDLKTADYRTLKDKLKALSNDKQHYETIQKEYVKSYEELVIANFLFINGVNYQYERTYEIDTSTPDKRQYTPDFYLTDYGIYLEHYGIDKNGRTPQYSKSDEERYLKGIEWKRNTHSLHQTKCIETYSYEFQNGEIFKRLKKRLTDNGVQLSPLSQEEIENTLDTIYLGKDFEAFTNLVSTFLNLYKSQYPNANGFDLLKSKPLSTDYDMARAATFLDIAKKIYEYYIKHLRDENKIDFDDMILQATAALDRLKMFSYKYVIVDEFQDISQSRNKFLQKIIQHGNSKLFAVGDDWQAIYRFAGCDINVFLHFDRYFEDVRFNYITTTHRNSAELQAIVEPFITANPEQFQKHIQSVKHQKDPVRIFYHNQNKSSAFTKVLSQIEKINNQANILILGRNRHDIDGLLSKDVQLHNSGVLCHRKFTKLNMIYKTVHQSKGLESEFVILISGEKAKNGFPNMMEDDHLLDLVLEEKSDFEYAEERRLFYVALTRTCSVVYILADKNKPSVFIREIEDRIKIEDEEVTKQDIDGARLCPRCKSGKLVLRQGGGTGKQFFGCFHYPYCEYTINDLQAVKVNNRCPDCGDFLVIRKGNRGKFIGCHNFPQCRFTRELHN